MSETYSNRQNRNGSGTPTRQSYEIGRRGRESSVSQIDILNIDDKQARRTLSEFYEVAKRGARSTSEEMRKMWILSTEYSDKYYQRELDNMINVSVERASNHRRRLREIEEEYNESRSNARSINDLNNAIFERNRKRNEERRKANSDELEYYKQLNKLESNRFEVLSKQDELKERYKNTKIGSAISEAEKIKLDIEAEYNKLNENSTIEELKEIAKNTDRLESQLDEANEEIKRTIDRAEERSNRIREVLKDFLRNVVENLTHNLKEGRQEYFNAYENSFTNFAGRMQTSYDDTRKFYGDSITALRREGLFSAANISKELIPAMTQAVNKGFAREDAISKAISDVKDNVVMPWLDTQSDAWVNMSFNMSKQNMDLLKSQQLQLQQTKAGNRLLQTGVINSLTSEMEPLLRNIDFNTGGANNLSREAQAMMASLVDSGMSPNEAYSQVLDAINVEKNVFGALTSGDVRKILMGQAAANGEGLFGQYDNIVQLYKQASGLDVVGASALNNIFNLGLSAGNSREAQRWVDAYNNRDKFLAADNTKILNKIYGEINGYRTSTVLFQNRQQNASAVATGWLTTAVPEGNRWFDSVLSLLKGISYAVIGGTVIDKLFNVLGSTKGGSIISRLFHGGGAAGAAGAGKGIVRTALGNAGKFIVSNAGTILQTGLGVAEIGYGGVNAYREIRNVASRTTTRGEKINSGISAAGYSFGVAGGVGAILASNPVGWISLAVGAVAIGATELYKSYNRTDRVLTELNEVFSNSKDIIISNNEAIKENIDTIREEINNASSLESKKKYLLENGLATEEQLSTMTTASIENFLETLDRYADNLKENQIRALEDLQRVTKEKVKGIKDADKDLIIKDIEGTADVSLRNEKLRALGYTDEQIERIGRDNYGGFLGIGTHKMTVRDLLNERTENKGILGIGGQSKLDAGGASLYDDYASVFNLDGYRKVSVDNDLLRQLAEAAGILDTYRGSKVPVHVSAYEEAKKFLKDNYGEYKSEIDAILKDDINSYAVGSSYIHKDQLAYLHEGERVLTKAQNEVYSRNIASILDMKNIMKSLLGLTNVPENKEDSNDDNDMSRSEMTSTLIDGMKNIVSVITNIGNSNGINYENKTLPRITNSYNNRIVNLQPVITASN